MTDVFVLFISITLLLCSCQPPLPQNIDAIFIKWFINSDTDSKNLLISHKLSAEALDSLATIAQSGETKTGTHSCILSDQDGTEYTLGFATPDHIIRDSLYPLIVYLHGGTGVIRNDKGENAYEMFRFLADTIDLFLASPSANKSAPWWNATGLNRILTTVRYMILHFPIDPECIILAGVSDGALGCYAAANAVNGPFAGFIAISGYGGILPKLGMELYPSNLMQRPIYSINGGKDHLYPVNFIEQFLDWLEENGVPVKRKIYPEEKHGFDYRVKETPTLIQIINTWRRPIRGNISWTIVPNVPNRPDNLLSWMSCNTESKMRILAYWQQDTLNIRSNGICSFSMVSDRMSADKLFYKSPEGIITPLKCQKPDTRQHLELMQRFCYPRTTDECVFRIKLD